MSGPLNTLDYALLAVYMLAVLAAGLWMSRGIRTGDDFFLAGRRLPWWAVGMSLVATDIGGTDIIGVGGAAYRHGIAVANFEWIGCVPAMLVAALVFVPFFWRLGVSTIPEYMERRYNPTMRIMLACCWLLFMACNLGIMLLASARMMLSLFDEQSFGWIYSAWSSVFPAESPESLWIVTTALLVGLYTCAGGLAAVVYTDAIQCGVMIAGCLLVLVLGLDDVGGVSGLLAGLESSRADVAAGMPASGIAERASLIVPVDTSTPFPWPGILFGLGMVLSPAYWIGNQAIVQRSLGTRSAFEAKASYVWGAILKNLVPILIAVPGLMAYVLFPELEEGDQALPRLVAAILPAGLRGVFLAAFIAALMSSVDSYLNSASTLFSRDLYLRLLVPGATDRHLVSVGRMTTVLLVVWAIFFSHLLTGFQEGIYVIFQTLMAFFQGPALAVLLAGVLWQRATAAGAVAGFVAGIFTSVGLFGLNQPPVLETLGWAPLFQIREPFLYFSVWSFLIALAVLVATSLLTPAEPPAKIRDLVYRKRGSKA
jgi:SSS family solute:Na+ symporter